MGDPDPNDTWRQLRDQGREAIRRRDWADAYASLSAADGHGPLDPEDLDLLAVTAFLVGQDEAFNAVTSRAYREWLHLGEHGRAARCAFWQGLHLILGGEASRGAGWLKRAQQNADAVGPDAVEQGYLAVPRALELLVAGDAAGARATSGKVVEYAERSGDPDLMAFGRLGLGQAMIHLGEVEPAMAQLDEVMVAVTSYEVSPVVAGIVYCAAIESCQRAFDLRRAQEWTAALSQWCAMQPDMVPYRGQCQIHRAEIMQLRGQWADALDEARLACARLGGQAAEGAAHYQVGELHRLRGQFTEAEQAFLAASRWMPEPQPGLALLRLAQGRVDAARASIEHILGDVATPAKVSPAGWSIARARLLGAYVEIMVADGDTAAARAGARELCAVAEAFGGPWLQALATTADGHALVAERTGAPALDVLREAWTAWQELDAPYEAARVRVLMAVACQQLGDTQTAEMELDAARWVFEELGATPDAARTRELSRGAGTGALTARETQVLRLVATGKTNRVIAAELFLSEKTVARHVSNIFVKLDVSSRAAATAYAYEHGLA